MRDPDAMTPEERFDEIAGILSRGVLRVCLAERASRPPSPAPPAPVAAAGFSARGDSVLAPKSPHSATGAGVASHQSPCHGLDVSSEESVHPKAG
jgi:hypothetical protein